MKKIIFLSLGFPDVTVSTHLYTDLMHEFLKHGHDVLVMAPSFDNKKKTEQVIESGMKIIRVPTVGVYGNNKFIKGFSNILLPYQYKMALKKFKVDLDFDLVIMPTPPITLIDLAQWIKKKSKAKLYLILRDIFPQNAIDLKMMKANGMIHRYFRKKEIKVYNLADKIGCMSPANITYLKKHNLNLDDDKLHLLPNWENLQNLNSAVSEAEIRKKYELENKLIAIFGGSMGIPQQVENIIELARKCIHLNDLVFLLIGRGTEYEKISKMVTDLKLTNVILKKALPKPEYFELLRISDIGLISLNKDFTIPNFPSRVNSYYGLKIPILASVDENTDFGVIQEAIGCGLYSKAGDTEAFMKNLLILYGDKKLRQQMGQKGYDYKLKNLLANNAYETIKTNIF
ncbi:glycosyltransferase family 4 protein [Maribacter sp. 2210JD10-5]|uniref:glycosyltransferase family 4 protein n=1 Tax=Maribacter sp. 2210JD10-5 TaxID=3386272 RepID=UPI0039BC38E2